MCKTIVQNKRSFVQRKEESMNKYIIDWKKYADIERRVAAEGIVLLKNEKKTLPLKKNERIAVFGRIQFDYYKSGTGSGGMVNTKYVVGILDALKEEELVLNEELEQVYRQWLTDHPFDMGKGWAQEPWNQQEMDLEENLVRQAAKQSDKAIVVIGRTAGEDRDAKYEKGSYLLTDEEEEMLRKVCEAFDQVIVLLNTGSIMDMRWVEVYQPSAVLYIWQGGMEGGHGVADVLMGRVNPCGRLSDTIAREIEDYPSTAEFGGSNGNLYREDIYVGYRYFETFAKEKVLYPFGYGLSYTEFQMEVLSAEGGYTVEMCGKETMDSQGAVDKSVNLCTDKRCAKEKGENKRENFRVQVRVTNAGAVSGREVVQLYVSAPQGQLGKPLRSLAAYGKTKNLVPGESQVLTLEFDEYTISSYDDSGCTGHKSAYVLEAGRYGIFVGKNVRDAVLAAEFEVMETKVTDKCSEALAPVREYERIRPVCAEGCKQMSEHAVGENTCKQVPEKAASGKGCKYTVGLEMVPQRTYSMTERMKHAAVPEIPYTGDQGYKLADVYDGRTDLDTFVAQLSDEDLYCMVRGEGMCSPKVTPGTAAAFGGVTEELKNFGIPCGCCADGPSGIRMDCGTQAFSLPNGTCLACTFDDVLVEQLYEMEGAELRKNRVDTLLGPGMNIHRNPLNGRNFEYFSEDPLLTGKIAASELRGMHKYEVTGTLKHFAANNQEYERHMYDSVASERALREIYLKGFEIAVKEGGAYSIMSTYGMINGLYTASNFDLLTTILRGEWGYEGMVMTDWWAKLNDEGCSGVKDNLAAMVRAQNDVYMVYTNAKENSNKDNLEESLKAGTLKRGVLQRSAKSILKFLLRSPAMLRMMDRVPKEELEAFESLEAVDKMALNLTFSLLEQELVLDTGHADTGMGKELLYGIEIVNQGDFQIRFTAKVEAGELAQVPVSVFANGVLRESITFHGTGGSYVEVVRPIEGLFDRFNYLRIYFAQSGVQLKEIRLERVNSKG